MHNDYRRFISKRFAGLFSPLLGARMKRINQYEFYNLGVTLHPLAALTSETKVGDVHFQLFQAHAALQLLIKGEPVSLVVAHGEATSLRDAVHGALPVFKKEMTPEQWTAERDKQLEFKAFLITNALEKFETVAAAELQVLDSYFVSKKGIYSTADLIDHADQALSEPVRFLMPSQAILDFRQAGRCLAFDLFTAAGFHSLRATDAVIRSYYALFAGHPPKPKLRNWGAYVRILKGCIVKPSVEDLKPDIKTLELVDHIREMHRNPIIHPEDNLDEDKALILFDLCKSAIVAMIAEMKEAKEHPTSSAPAPLVITGTSILTGKVKALK